MMLPEVAQKTLQIVVKKCENRRVKELVGKFRDSKDAKDATGLMLDVLMFPECVLYNSVHGIGQQTGATP